MINCPLVERQYEIEKYFFFGWITQFEASFNFIITLKQYLEQLMSIPNKKYNKALAWKQNEISSAICYRT